MGAFFHSLAVPTNAVGEIKSLVTGWLAMKGFELRPEPPLWPQGARARARARQIEHRSDEVYFPHVIRLMALQPTPDDPAAVEARAGATAYYDAMEHLIGDKDWLAGSYSYADIAFYMAQLFGARMTAPMGEAHPRLQAWRERMSARPAVAKVAGAMGRYLKSQARPLPEFLARLST